MRTAAAAAETSLQKFYAIAIERGDFTRLRTGETIPSAELIAAGLFRKFQNSYTPRGTTIEVKYWKVKATDAGVEYMRHITHNNDTRTAP